MGRFEGEMFFHLRKSKKFEEKRAKLYAAELLLALEYLHKRNVIYRYFHDFFKQLKFFKISENFSVFYCCFIDFFRLILD